MAKLTSFLFSLFCIHASLAYQSYKLYFLDLVSWFLIQKDTIPKRSIGLNFFQGAMKNEKTKGGKVLEGRNLEE